MYYVEWLMWQACIATPKGQAEAEDYQRNEGLHQNGMYEGEYAQELRNTCTKVSDTPKLRGPVYAYNDTVLELRCGMFEPWRGLVTLLSGAAIGVLCSMLAFGARTIWYMVTVPDFSVGGGLFLAIPPLAIAAGVAWLYFKYGRRISRLEMLTSRHLLIRFNRKTRQVYLHRPRYCGGIVTLPWKNLISGGATPNAPESSDVGSPLVLMWPPKTTGLPHNEYAFIGPQAQGYSELRDEWEFIRRFMEDGPDGLPKPHITSHFPWPWQAFTAQFEGVSRFFASASPAMTWGLILISPAFLCLGLLHWLSLLLCWKPRWPKVIREAGLPGKPTPKLTTLADYPPDIQQRLLANADKWVLKPGSRPERISRASRRKKTGDDSADAAADTTDA